MVPDFTDDGLLPQGIHKATWSEIVKVLGFNKHRTNLLGGLKRALSNLQKAKCKVVYLDGSFVTNKTFPKDFDCCWDIQDVDANELDPVFLEFSNFRASQKAKYLGEFFPSHFQASVSGDVYLNFFQQDKHSGNMKGIILIDLEEFEND